MHLPADAKARKATPIYSGVVRYFPKALAAVAELSRKGNEQHNPGQPLHWDRSKSTDELDALMRHLVDAGTVDTDKVRHSTKVAWRALANLEKELEASETVEQVAYGSGVGVTVKCVRGHHYNCSYTTDPALSCDCGFTATGVASEPRN